MGGLLCEHVYAKLKSKLKLKNKWMNYFQTNLTYETMEIVMGTNFICKTGWTAEHQLFKNLNFHLIVIN